MQSLIVGTYRDVLVFHTIRLDNETAIISNDGKENYSIRRGKIDEFNVFFLNS